MNFLYVISTDRLDAKCLDRFSACLGSLARQTIADSLRVCIADYSTHSSLSKLDIPESLRWDYFHRPLSSSFNKPFCINHGYKRFRIDQEPYFFFSDIDLVYPETFVDRLVTKYSRLDPKVCATALQFYQQPARECYTPVYADARDTIHDDIRYEGGCLMISTALFNELRGYDERYFGWGGEDDDFFMRAGYAGVFIVDESLELVHMYHPADRRKQSSNTERLNRRRRDRSDWFNQRTWGEWDHRPRDGERTEAILETGMYARSPYFCAIVGDNSLRLRDLRNRIDHGLTPAEFTTWMMSDGLTGVETVSAAIADNLCVDGNESARLAFESSTRLSDAELISIGVRSEARPLVQLGIVDPGAMTAAEIKLLIWILSHEFDVVFAPASAQDSDITIVRQRGAEPPPEPGDGPGMKVLWSTANRYPTSREFAYDLVLTPLLVSHEHRQRAVRLPRWTAAFNWENGRDDEDRISPSILTDEVPREREPEWEYAILSREGSYGPAPSAWIDTLRRSGRSVEVPASTHPRKKFELFRRSKFTAVEEPGILAGGLGEDLVLAIASGSVPVYGGDPAVHWDINPGRFLAASGGSGDEVLSRIEKLAGDVSSYRRLASGRLFRNDGIPGWLLPQMVARPIRDTWEMLQLRRAHP